MYSCLIQTNLSVSQFFSMFLLRACSSSGMSVHTNLKQRLTACLVRITWLKIKIGFTSFKVYKYTALFSAIFSKEVPCFLLFFFQRNCHPVFAIFSKEVLLFSAFFFQRKITIVSTCLFLWVNKTFQTGINFYEKLELSVKDRICSWWSKIFLLRVNLYFENRQDENGKAANHESVPINLNGCRHANNIADACCNRSKATPFAESYSWPLQAECQLWPGQIYQWFSGPFFTIPSQLFMQDEQNLNPLIFRKQNLFLFHLRAS